MNDGPDEMKEFDILTTPLDGSNLIEASAGTGKTFAIAGIVVRLLLEEAVSIGEILVVTYTTAATEELRDRVRRAIRNAIDAFVHGPADDPFLAGLVGRHPESGQAVGLLKTALRDFDQAAIHTIHGFCQQTLRENTFESLNAFDQTLLTDERPLVEEIVQDFWRRRLYDAPIEIAASILERGDTPRTLAMMVQKALRVQAVPDIDAEGASGPFPPTQLIRDAFAGVCAAWDACRQDIRDALSHTGLNRTKYGKPEILMEGMDRYIRSGLALPAFPRLDRFASSGIAAAVKKGATAPDHSFFHLCEDLKAALARFEAEMDACLLRIKAELIGTVRRELPRRKERLRIQSFDDLLTNLNAALESPGNDALITELRKRYRAALIDEFQDTDPVQYAIFRSIFRGEGRTLFLIGDPKQAIYGFRGADLFTYMTARKEVERAYTLSRNWRSGPDLIQALNAFFTHASDAFVYPEIQYRRVSAAETIDRETLRIAGSNESPLQLWFAGTEYLAERDAWGSRERTRMLIARTVAAEAARLIELGRDQKAFIGDREVGASDIAVLVRDRHEAQAMQEAMRALGVPNLLHSAGNVFDTVEAEELLRLIAAIAEPSREGLVCAALSTIIMGLSGEAIAALQEDERAWEDRILSFREYNRLWETQGFIVMFRDLLRREQARERLLAFPDGERRLTNFLHIAEILHTEESVRRPGMGGLIKWLVRQRDPDSPRNEEHELRLESDAQALRIVTIHKSKGLEYPIVFCPGNWGGSRIGDRVFAYHEERESGDGWVMKLALDERDGPHLALAEREALAENLRLLYVSLTRARHRCYVVWGPFKNAGTSALSYLLHAPNASGDLDAMERSFEALSPADFRRDLEALATRSGGTIAVVPLPDTIGRPLQPAVPGSENLTCRTLAVPIERSERIASFSYLIAGHPTARTGDYDMAGEFPDRDAVHLRPLAPPALPPSGIFAFPRGTHAGTALHEILERIDFQDTDRKAREDLVDATLRKHGFDPTWRDMICTMLGKVVEAPLDLEVPGLSLSAVGSDERISELQFYFPLKPINPEALDMLFSGIPGAPYGAFPEQLGRLRFQPAKGFMRGFIDLVFRYGGRFYLVDWKSNDLGHSREDYAPEALVMVMAEERYILQYHLYILALHRYLKERLPGYDYDRHMGGAFYLFLRGIDPAWGPESGIFYDRPKRAMVENLESRLIGELGDGSSNGIDRESGTEK